MTADDDDHRGRRRVEPRLTRRSLIAGAAVAAAALAVESCSSSMKSGTDAGLAAQPTVGTSATTSPVAAAGTTSAAATTGQATTAPGVTSAEVTNAALPSTMPSSTTVTTSAGPATFVDHGPPNSDMVALTFHLSGQPAIVNELLDLLKKRGVTVTAFAVGTWITAHSSITQRLVADGHELGNHTEHHVDMGSLTPQQLRDEIVECGQALIPFIGSIGKWFRPSATVVPGPEILAAAGEAGYATSVGYDVDSLDFRDPGADAVVANVVSRVHPGAIISLHFGHRGTIAALPRILDHLTAVNLRPVTVGELLR